MKREPLYRKEGRRYRQVNDPYALDGLTPGAWSVVVDDGMVSVRKQLDPAWNEVDAALKLLDNELAKIISRESELTSAIPYTPKQKELIDRMRAELGDQMFTHFNYPSSRDIAEAVLKHVSLKIAETRRTPNAPQGVPLAPLSTDRLFNFSYKHPKKRRLKVFEVLACSFQEAESKAPRELVGGYIRYGVA